MSNLSLFDEPYAFGRNRLATQLRVLSQHNILIGGSSWKYEGWLGQIYSRERYLTRGRFSRKKFEQECLTEYAETFSIVCGDFSFYQFPTEEFWVNLFAQSPGSLKFAFKVPEEVTRKTFPRHPRYGARAGRANPSFLDAALFESAFLQPLTPFRERIPLLIFEFGTFSTQSYADVRDFSKDLNSFLLNLSTEWNYAVEIRNEEFLDNEYFDVLRNHGVAHVFNAWNRMPPLYNQIRIAEAFTADFTVVRGLLRAGRSYEQAVTAFEPYDRIQDPNPQTREAIREIIGRSRKRRESAYLFINNRLEGSAPLTIKGIVEGLDESDFT